jgi:hypothetical protein
LRQSTGSGSWLHYAAVSAVCFVAALTLAPPTQRLILLPTIAALVVYGAFTIALWRRVQAGLFGEIGFFFVTVAVAYTVMPAATFLLVDVDFAKGWVWEKLSLLLPAMDELATHLWRHVLFIACVAASYLALRGDAVAAPPRMPRELPGERKLIGLAAALVLTAATLVSLWSAPVVQYVDHYTRFEHLGWFELRAVYVLLTLKTSAYFVLMAILFRRFPSYRLLAITAVFAICAYELSYSKGSRIETLSIMLGAACLYQFTVKPFTMKAVLVGLIAISALFSVVEVVRMLDLGGSGVAGALADEELGPASEFGAVFFTGYHLYADRASGGLPPAEWPMLINDLLAALPFVDHEMWNPMYWYARNYFPDAIVPPATMGPIAESAVWGGEIDLAIRAGLIGALYAGLMRWFLRRRTEWWALVIYSYLFATCVMTLKYSVLYQLAPLVRILGPGLLLFWVAIRCFTPHGATQGVRRPRQRRHTRRLTKSV